MTDRDGRRDGPDEGSDGSSAAGGTTADGTIADGTTADETNAGGTIADVDHTAPYPEPNDVWSRGHSRASDDPRDVRR